MNLVKTLKIGTLKIENGSQHIGIGHDSSLFNENREPENWGWKSTLWRWPRFISVQCSCQLGLQARPLSATWSRQYYRLFWTYAPGWACPLGAGTSDRWSLFAAPVKWNWNLELLNSYAPTSSQEINSSLKARAPTKAVLWGSSLEAAQGALCIV